MKKIIIILVLLTLIAAGAFAQVFSFGGGALFDASFYNGVNIRERGDSFHMGLRSVAPGVFAFFDAEFVQAQVSLIHGWHTVVSNYTHTGNVETEDFGRSLAMGFNVLGKFPFVLGPDIVVFPLFGAHYNLVFHGISGEISDDYYFDIIDFSQFGLLAGAGIDLFLTNNLFLRAEAMFDFRFPSRFFRDVRNDWNRYEDSRARTTFGMGPRINIGVGYSLDFGRWW